MNFELSPEQVGIVDSLKRFLVNDYSFDKRQKYSSRPQGYSQEAWQMYADLGLLALPFPAEYDGLEGSSIDTLLVMDTLGKALCLEPYISTVVMCGTLLVEAGSEAQKQELLPKIASGQIKLSFAHFESHMRNTFHLVKTTATSTSGTWSINGHKHVVLDAPSADYLIVSARTKQNQNSEDESGISLFLIKSSTPGVTLHSYKTQDGGMAADIEFNNVQLSANNLLGNVNDAYPMIEKILCFANAALCAEAIGVMTALNEFTLEYLKTRKQFGVPIGKFQALQHRMGDMFISTEQARSMAYLAALSLSDVDSKKRNRDCSAAKAYICKAGRQVGQEAVQLHGGMGVTNELNTAHYFKKMTMITQTYGDYDYHLDKVSSFLVD
ncbi:MAG: acyl-CoA dehydrogenase family protein [Betaproteobacteria bacterium]